MSLDFLFLPDPFDVVTGATSLHVSNSTAANCDENAAMSKLDRLDESERDDISDNGKGIPSPQKRLANNWADSLFERTFSSISLSDPSHVADSDTTL